MYKIERAEYGYKLTFGGNINKSEIENWYQEVLKLLPDMPDRFCVFVDMRTIRSLRSEVSEMMQKSQNNLKEKGMLRSAVVLSDPVIEFQFKQIAKESGIFEGERYFDVAKNENWHEDALNWLLHGQ